MTRKEAHVSYKKLFSACRSDKARNALFRELCLRDLFFLLAYGLGRRDVDRDWTYDRCREVEAEPDGRLDLWAREHYKSTIITFGLTIRDILNDPEITVGIFSHTRPIAKGFLRQIKQEFETNVKLKGLFPEILWENAKQAAKWSEDDGITVRRASNPKEATVEAWGLVDGQPTSKHFRLLVYDDVVTRESVTTPDQIAKVNKAWELSLNLGSEGGRRRYIGTRYHYNDTYKLIMDRRAAVPRIHPATKDGKPTGKAVLLTKEILEEKRRDMGPYTFACQLLLDPRADDVQGFKLDWLKTWPAQNHSHLNKIVLCDPAGEKKKENDYTVAMVIGLGEDENYYVVDMVRDRLSLTERGNLIMKLHREYRPTFVGYEKYGKDSDIEFIQFLQERDNYRFGVTALKGALPKNDRIRKLIPLFEQGRVYLPDHCIKTSYDGRTEDLVRVFANEEYLAFPVPVHDDMLDCLARIMDPDCTRDFPSRRDASYEERAADTWLDGFGGRRRDEAEYHYDIYAR